MTEQRRGRPNHKLRVRGRDVELGPRTLVMGVVNVTPDSFSDGGRFGDADGAVAHALELAEAGADIVDVGGESTRPGARAVAPDDEIARVVPVIERLRRRSDVLVSIDTTKAAVARAALAAGADIVNDVIGLAWDPPLGAVVAAAGAPIVLMHLRGGFDTMHATTRYDDVMGEVASELRAALARAEAHGIPRAQVLLDPGIGFSKQADHSLQVLRRLDELHALGCPLLVGPSRKSFIGRVLDAPADRRLFGTAAAVAVAVMAGAHVVRVHDVAEMAQVVRVCDAVLAGAAPVAAGAA